MPKNDFMSPKAIANRIKSKGLQKLRWYCQMCEKQCRDENGFKCHLTSEGHKRQMMVFGQNPDRVIDDYTSEFKEGFLALLKQAHGQSRVSAKVVYNEYINDRNHVHMNATNWLTLTDFVKWLGREGICRVDETPKGWFVSLIMQDPLEQLSDERRIKRAKHEKADEDRTQAALDAQIERAQASAGIEAAQPHVAADELVRGEGDQPLSLSLLGPGRLAKTPAAALAEPRPAPGDFAVDDERGSRPANGSSRPKSMLEELMKRDLAKKKASATSAAASQAQNRQPGRTDLPWVAKGIIVKVMSRELQAQGYYKKKGLVVEAPTPYVGEIEMLDSGDVLRVDQAQLETVLPALGGSIAVVVGKHRGQKGVMLAVHADDFQAEVELGDGTKLLLAYEDVCKLA